MQSPARLAAVLLMTMALGCARSHTHPGEEAGDELPIEDEVLAPDASDGTHVFQRDGGWTSARDADLHQAPDRPDSQIAGDADVADGCVFATCADAAITDGAAPSEDCAPKILAGDFAAHEDALLAALAGVTELQGSLKITSNVQDLSPLRCLKTIRGDLELAHLLALRALSLNALREVDGKIVLGGGNVLTSVEMPNLTKLGSDGTDSLVVRLFPKLERLAFPRLAEIAGDVRMEETGSGDSAPLMLEFSSLAAVHGAVRITHVLNLQSLHALSQVTTLERALLLEDNAALTTIDLTALQRLGALIIRRSPQLQHILIPALTTLLAVDGYSLRLDALPLLNQLEGKALQRTDGNVSFTNLSVRTANPFALSFPSLTVIGGGLSINSVRSLSDLDGFPKLEAIRDGLNVSNAVSITRIELPTLRGPTAGIRITTNPLLTRIDLSAITSVGAAGGIELSSLPKLLSADLGSIAGASRDVMLSVLGTSADAPLALDLSNLSEIQGAFAVGQTSLESFAGFTKLEAVRGAMGVSDNRRLTSLAGLAGLATQTGALSIRQNPLLSTCAAKQLQMRVKGAGDTTSTVTGNLADGC